ncbi:MAG TPA: hypothetical protein VMM36_03500 [Opitutaceae bacterium]|nr:hypothetical protein [Opitutaceae bacterium]
MPRPILAFLRLATASLGLARLAFAEPSPPGSPADHLPPHIKHLTHFGERPDWSHDGTKFVFLSKMFGDALEFDVATGHITNLTDFYPHHGNVRAMYLSNGDILLSAPEAFDPKDTRTARRNSFLMVLGRDGKTRPVPLGVRCNEGPAISRSKLTIAWTEWVDPKPGEGNLAFSKMYAADIVYTDGVPALANRRLIKDGADMPFRCTMETQNFNPANEDELIFNTYTEGGQKCDVFGINLKTGELTRYTDSPELYDEAEGIFPDGKHTLVECDVQRPGGPGNLDLWKLALDGSGAQTRLTHFNDYPGYKATNGVVSDDGRYLAFQMGFSGDEPGIGHGIFVLDLEALP